MKTENPAASNEAEHKPARQTGEDKGVIKRPQQTDATMAGKDLARGSEMETRLRPRMQPDSRK